MKRFIGAILKDSLEFDHDQLMGSDLHSISKTIIKIDQIKTTPVSQRR